MTDWPGAPEHAHSAEVRGRPTGYSAGANERVWKAAVGESLREVVLGADVPVGVELRFRLRPDQVGHLEPDLDNLIKSTIDAMIDCIGRRAMAGRPQADDGRVVSIAASKSWASSADEAGATIRVWEVHG